MPAPTLSTFARSLTSETAFDVLAVAKKLKAAGKDVIELQIGDSPFPSSTSAVRAGKAAIDAGRTQYGPSLGLPEFRAAAAKMVADEFGVPATAANVVAAPGAKPFEQFFCEAFLDPGDQVLVFEPSFPTYVPNIVRRGAVPVFAALRLARQFRPDPADVERFLAESDRPKAIFLNTPHNPTGGVATAADLTAIADLVRGRDVAVFSDEPYCHMVWDGEHRSPLALPGMLDQCVGAYTFSKSYSMSGWRLGFAVASPAVAEAMGKMINTAVSCVPPFVQLAGRAALENDAAERDAVMAKFRAKVELLVGELRQVPDVTVLDAGRDVLRLPERQADQRRARHHLARAGHVPARRGGRRPRRGLPGRRVLRPGRGGLPAVQLRRAGRPIDGRRGLLPGRGHADGPGGELPRREPEVSISMTGHSRPRRFAVSTDAQPRTETVYPESDGQPMADNTLQWDWMVKIVGELREQYAGQDVFVAGDLFWYPVEGDPKTVIAPDALVVFGRPAGYRGSYKQWLEAGLGPQVVFEVLSPSNTEKEMNDKLAFYERFGVEEYYEIDPYRPYVLGFVRSENRLVPVHRMTGGHVSPRLGTRYELVDGDLKMFGPDGREFQTREERVGEILEELRRTEGAFEQERERAIAEERRADEEQRRADDEQRRKEVLAAKLRELGVDPDDLLRSA